MPWNKTNYPNSMKNLPVKVRNKAIEIANALLDERSMEEGILIATAISRAKDWAANRGLETTTDKSRSTDVKQHGEDRYVIPHEEKEWAVKKEATKKVEKTFRNKSEAIKLAKEKAQKAKSGVTIQRRTGKVEKRISYNPKNKASKIKPTV